MKQEPRIRFIVQAFSMQPLEQAVCEEINHANSIKYNSGNPDYDCKEIRVERIEIGKRCGDPVEELYYVGYNFEDKILFKYIANTVNVHYFAIEPQS